MKPADIIIFIATVVIGIVTLFFVGRELFTGESFARPEPTYYIHYATRSPR